MEAINTVKDALSRLFGRGQIDNEEALFSGFSSVEGDRFGAPPGRESFGDGKIEDDPGLELPPASGQQDMERSAGLGAGKEIGDMAEPEEQTNEGLPEAITEIVRGEDQDPAEESEVDARGVGSEGYGDLSLDIFASDDIPDEEAVGLPEGLIDVDAEALLDECRRIAERLIELPKGQSILNQRQADARMTPQTRDPAAAPDVSGRMADAE